MRPSPGRASPLSFYERGETSMFACRFDQRFSYCLYVPARCEEEDAEHALVIAVHGSGRGAQRYRKEFVDLAEGNRCIVLAPVFTWVITERVNRDNYKLI